MRVDANDEVSSTTRSLRRVRAEQLDLVHAAVSSGRWAGGARFRSPTAWLVGATGESAGQCRITLMLADRIQRMLLVKAAFAAGELAESALRQLAETWCEQVADAFAHDEAMLLRWAQRLSFDDLRVTLATWRLYVDPDCEERTAQERFDARKLHLSELLDGMGRLDGVLDPEGFKLVQEAIRDLSAKCADDDRRLEQRRADALVTLARFYLANGKPADATAAGTPSAGQPGKRRRPKVIGAIELSDLMSGAGAGTVDTGSGRIVVSSEAIRRMCCDAGFHRLVYAADGTVLDFGRQTRAISDSLFEVLAARDHGCRIKDCPVSSGGCDAHHADHWADHGETEPDNLALLCWFHHHLVHEQHWSIKPLGAGHFLLIDPDGGEHEMRPPMIAGALPRLAPAA
jgi:hypothetical protein